MRGEWSSVERCLLIVKSKNIFSEVIDIGFANE